MRCIGKTNKGKKRKENDRKKNLQRKPDRLMRILRSSNENLKHGKEVPSPSMIKLSMMSSSRIDITK